MMIHKITATGTGVGADASATFTTYTTPIRGKILSIDVLYEATVPAPESDVVISDNLGSDEAILTLTNKVADGRFYPRTTVDDNVGVEIASTVEYHYVDGPLKIVGSQLDTDDVISFVIFYED
jgi:hypothetical protein